MLGDALHQRAMLGQRSTEALNFVYFFLGTGPAQDTGRGSRPDRPVDPQSLRIYKPSERSNFLTRPDDNRYVARPWIQVASSKRTIWLPENRRQPGHTRPSATFTGTVGRNVGRGVAGTLGTCAFPAACSDWRTAPTYEELVARTWRQPAESVAGRSPFPFPAKSARRRTTPPQKKKKKQV